MSHRSRGPIRLFAVSFLFTASLAIGAGGALAADPDGGRPDAATTVSPTPLSDEKPTCAPTQTETAAPVPGPRGGSTPTAPTTADPQPTETASATATPTATPVAKPLASTGSNAGPIVGVVAVALAVGGVLFFVARRRATS